jgi:hypothetical protein
MDSWQHRADEVVELLKEWHPGWCVEVFHSGRFPAISFTIWLDAQTQYKYTTDIAIVMSQKPETTAWFMSKVVSGARERHS